VCLVAEWRQKYRQNVTLYQSHVPNCTVPSSIARYSVQVGCLAKDSNSGLLGL